MVLLSRRLMINPSVIYKSVTGLAIIVIVAGGIIFCFVSMLQCMLVLFDSFDRLFSADFDSFRPLREYWSITQRKSKCLNQTQELMVSGIINTVTDFIVVLLPLPIVWNLRLEIVRRVQIISLLAAGLLVCCAGIMRNIYTYQLTQTWDASWAIFPVFITSTVELNFGIVSQILTYKIIYLSDCRCVRRSRL